MSERERGSETEEHREREGERGREGWRERERERGGRGGREGWRESMFICTAIYVIYIITGTDRTNTVHTRF